MMHLSFLTQRPLIKAALLCVALLSTTTGWAQTTDADSKSMRDVLEAEEKAEKLIEEKEHSDPDGVYQGLTPLSTLLGLREAMQRSDYSTAGEYLDMRYLPDELDDYTKEQLVKALAHVWSQQNIVSLDAVSDDEQGNLHDGLPSYRDKIGSVILSTGEVPVYLQRVPDGRGGKVWKLSNATVAKIPEMWEELGYSPVAIYFNQVLPDFRIMGMDNWQAAATLLFFLLAWPVATLLSRLLMRLALLIPNRFPKGIESFFRGPLRFFLFILLARIMVQQLGLSLTARILLESSGVDYIAYTVLLMGLVSLVRDYQIRKMQAAGNAQYAALLRPISTIIKVLLVTGIALVWADSAGYNMSTILAGLGVGSLAVALAAQKTLENLIGAITLYTARPVNPGDFCRFGDVVGTVEEIGLRSTTLRTLNRTIVVIPNSVFASVEIENYSVRDRIRYFRNVRLQLTDANQLRVVLAQLRKLFYAHPEVLQETVSIRFDRIDDTIANLRLDGGINTTDFQAFLAVAEDLNLRIVEIVHGAGAVFTGPDQVLHLQQPEELSTQQKNQISSTLQQWNEQDKQPFPNYSQEEISSFKGSLDYPPSGAAS